MKRILLILTFVLFCTQTNASTQITVNSSAIGPSGLDTQYATLMGDGNRESVGTWTGGEADREGPITTPGTFSNLRIVLDTVAGAGNSWAFTIRKDGANSALTCTISGDTDLTCADTANSFTITATDITNTTNSVSIQVVPTSDPTTSLVSWSVQFDGDNSGESFLIGHSRGSEWGVGNYVAVGGGGC